MKITSTYKLLFLLNLITIKERTKNQIIEEFKNSNIKITRPLITHYINKLIQSGFCIKTEINKNREKIYFLEKEKLNIELSTKELLTISKIKKLIISQKNYNRIRQTMRLFYKISQYINDEDTKLKLIDFGYYSTINWNLVKQLEEHCKEKNYILIDYILPYGKNKHIKINVDRLEINTWSQRLYLHGAIDNAKRFSHLPVDRIFMVKKILEKNNSFNEIKNNFTYTVCEKAYNKLFKDKKEKIIKVENGKITIERPIDDELYILQRLLYFCPDIYYISNEKIKNLLKEKLELIKGAYGSKLDR